MQYSEFRRHLGKAGLTVNEFASLIQVKPTSVSNYAQKQTVPQLYAIVAVLLGDAADRSVNALEVLSRFQVPTSQSKIVTKLDEFRFRRKGSRPNVSKSA